MHISTAIVYLVAQRIKYNIGFVTDESRDGRKCVNLPNSQLTRSWCKKDELCFILYCAPTFAHLGA